MTKDESDWRVVNLPGKPGGLRGFRRTRRKIKELDAAAAAVSRCEAILEASEPLRPSGPEEGIVRSGQAPTAETVRRRELLARLVREEQALKRYLDSAEDPVRAFANAKGDVAYLNRLRSSDYWSFMPKSSFGKVLLPIVIVLLTALSANVVGIILQSLSLRNNRTFEVNLERLRESQRLAGNLYLAATDFQQRAASDEAKGALGLRAGVTLSEFRKQLQQIRNIVAGKSSQGIDEALVSANEQVNRTDECFKEQARNVRGSAGSCAGTFSTEPFSRLQDAISLALVNYLE